MQKVSKEPEKQRNSPTTRPLSNKEILIVEFTPIIGAYIVLPINLFTMSHSPCIHFTTLNTDVVKVE